MAGLDIPVLYRSVFECQSDGVVAIGLDGNIMLFNAAAGRILGLNPHDVMGRLFAEALLVEGLDDFNQAIVDAISDRSVGETRTISVHRDRKRRTVAATTSYLRNSSDASAQNIGVVVVFSDITEMEELRQAEARAAESLRAQHAELQQAYRNVEESSVALKSTMKKFQIARIGATGLVIALFVAAGAYSWSFGLFDARSAPGHADGNTSLRQEPRDLGALRTLVVRPRPLTSSISSIGRLAPWRKVNVTSPITARVSVVHFRYGQTVRKGERLVELHIAEIKREHRDAQKDYIEALKQFRELQDWDSNPEVSRARRSLTKAQVALRNLKSNLDASAFLLEQGVIPANQHKAVKRQYFNQQLDFQSAKQNLQTVLAKNSEERRQVRRLALDNAQERLRALEEGLKGGEIVAPISGVVLDTRETGAKSGNGSDTGLARGQSVQEGQTLLTIGDLRRMSVVTAVDEVHIPGIRVGQRIRATGDGFPDLVLEGTLSHVSSEAHAPSDEALPAFEIVGVLDELDAPQHGRLRLGMSVDIDIFAYHNPAALVVPIEAVALRQDKRWLRVRDRDARAIREVEVETGVTTVDSVEILRGIGANDEIVLPGD